MIRDALSRGRLLAMALLKPGYERDYHGSPEFFPIGCLARIEEIEWLPNDCYDLKLRGLARVHFDRLVREYPYRAAAVRVLPEAPCAEDDPLVQIDKQTLFEAYQRWRRARAAEPEPERVSVGTEAGLQRAGQHALHVRRLRRRAASRAARARQRDRSQPPHPRAHPRAPGARRSRQHARRRVQLSRRPLPKPEAPIKLPRASERPRRSVHAFPRGPDRPRHRNVGLAAKASRDSSGTEERMMAALNRGFALTWLGHNSFKLVTRGAQHRADGSVGRGQSRLPARAQERSTSSTS